MAPQKWNPDLKMRIKHDDWYARTWERDYERKIFNAENDNVTPRISSKNVVRSELWDKKRGTHQGPHERVPQTIFPKRIFI